MPPADGADGLQSVGGSGAWPAFSTEPYLSSSGIHVGARTRRVTQLICARLLHGRSMNPTSLPNQQALCRCEKQGSLQTPQKKKKKEKKSVRSSWETEELKKTIATSQSTYPNHPPTTSFICWRTSKNKLAPTRSGRWASPESSLNSLLSYSCMPAASEQVGYK